MDYVKANVRHGEGRRERQTQLARRPWTPNEPTWGNFGVRESVSHILPLDLDGARTA